MRVHLQNVIGTAIERGVRMGYCRASKVAQFDKLQEIDEKFINTILDHIWESLDDFVDFSEPEDNNSGNRPIGFVDATSTQWLPNRSMPDDEIIPPENKKTLDTAPTKLYTSVHGRRERNHKE
jgi:hypothetical protein